MFVQGLNIIKDYALYLDLGVELLTDYLMRMLSGIGVSAQLQADAGFLQATFAPP
jgi:hypothetical protein